MQGEHRNEPAASIADPVREAKPVGRPLEYRGAGPGLQNLDGSATQW